MIVSSQDEVVGTRFALPHETTKKWTKYETMIFRHWTSGSIGQWPERWETKNTILSVAPAYYLERVSRPKLRELDPRWSLVEPLSWRRRTRSQGCQEFLGEFPKRRAPHRKRDRKNAQEIYRVSLLSLQLNSDQLMCGKKPPKPGGKSHLRA